MKRWLRNVLKIAPLLLVFCSGCVEIQSPAVAINPADFIPDGKRIRHGRRLFQTICIKCHRPKDIRVYTDKEWEDIIGKKLKKDPLMMTRKETKDIVYFLVYGNSGSSGFFPGGTPVRPVIPQQTLKQ